MLISLSACWLQVNACIDKFIYTQRANRLAVALTKDGKEVPKTFEGMSRLMGAPTPLLCVNPALRHTASG